MPATDLFIHPMDSLNLPLKDVETLLRKHMIRCLDLREHPGNSPKIKKKRLRELKEKRLKAIYLSDLSKLLKREEPASLEKKERLRAQFLLHFNDLQRELEASHSKKQKKKKGYTRCRCNVESRCGNDCLNVVSKLECNMKICGIRLNGCKNRKFTTSIPWLTDVECRMTKDRNYGLFSSRRFTPHEFIIEYTGNRIELKDVDDTVCTSKPYKLYFTNRW
jgi:hypothetical protein